MSLFATYAAVVGGFTASVQMVRGMVRGWQADRGRWPRCCYRSFWRFRGSGRVRDCSRARLDGSLPTRVGAFRAREPLALKEERLGRQGKQGLSGTAPGSRSQWALHRPLVSCWAMSKS